jgi:hypothetical protein
MEMERTPHRLAKDSVALRLVMDRAEVLGSWNGRTDTLGLCDCKALAEGELYHHDIGKGCLGLILDGLRGSVGNPEVAVRGRCTGYRSVDRGGRIVVCTAVYPRDVTGEGELPERDALGCLWLPKQIE